MASTYAVSSTAITGGNAQNGTVTLVSPSTLLSRNTCLATNLTPILENDTDLVVYIGSVEIFRHAIMDVSGLVGATPALRFAYFLNSIISY